MKDNRRDFIKKSTALTALSFTGIGAAGTAMTGCGDRAEIPFERVEKSAPVKSDMKIAIQAKTEPSEEDITFIQQMGLDQVVLWTNGSQASAEYYASRKKIYGDAGINVFGFGNRSVHNQDAIVLNLPGRDEKIEEYLESLYSMKKNIWIADEVVGRDDPRIRGGINILRETYNLAHDKKFEDLCTATSHLTGEKINRFCHIHQSKEDLFLKQRMTRVLCHRVSGCIQRCMGIDALNALSVITYECDQALGTNYYENFKNFLD